MTTSGTIDSSDTVRNIVKDALVELQVIASTQEPSASDMALGVRRLNWMLKEWQNDGVNLWRQSGVTINWPAATAEGDLTSDEVGIGVEDILDLRLVGTTERRLERWELADYDGIPSKATTGSPSIYAMTRELSGVRLRLWPVSATAITLKATIARTIEDVSDANETLDVPQRYTRTVIMNLAANMASAFAKQVEGQMIAAEATRLYRILRANDRPASYFLEPAGGFYGY